MRRNRNRSWTRWKAVVGAGGILVLIVATHLAAGAQGLPGVSVVGQETGPPGNLALSVTIVPVAADRDQVVNVYVVAIVSRTAFFGLRADGNWLPLGAELPVYRTGVLGDSIELPIAANVNTAVLPRPTEVYAGYGRDQADLLTGKYGRVYGNGVVSPCTPHSAPQRTQTSLAVDPTDHDVVYVGVEGDGVFKTIDGGATWRKIVSGIKGRPRISGPGLCYSEFYSTTIDPRNPQHLCVATPASPGTLASLVSDKEGIYCSEDGGETWGHRVTSTMNTACYSVAIDPGDSNVLYAGGNNNPASNQGADSTVTFHTTGVIYKSTDGGVSWRELTTPLAKGLRVFDLAIDPGDPRIVYGSTTSLRSGGGTDADPVQYGVLKTMDGGLTWTANTAGLNTSLPAYAALTRLALSPNNPQRLFTAALSAYTYWSSDGARTFVPSGGTSGGGFITVFAFDPHDPTGGRLIGVAAFQPNVYVSADGGATWTVHGTLPAETVITTETLVEAFQKKVNLTAIRWSRQDPNVLYLAGSFGSVYKSIDGGVSWRKILSGTSLPQ